MNEQIKVLAEDLISFIDKSPTAYHAAANIAEVLDRYGFKKLCEKDSWMLEPKGKYYVVRNDSAVAAFICGKKPVNESGIRIAGAHTDSPSLKIKMSSEKKSGGLHKITTEVYGGPIINTWFDRDLSIAGRIMVKRDGKWNSELVDLTFPVAVLPNLAIHLNREVNKGFEFNKQTHLAPVFSDEKESEDKLLSKIAESLNVEKEFLGEADLFFYDTQKGSFTGFDEEFICSGRLDNLSMCHSILTAIAVSEGRDETVASFFFDNEEIGSATLQGADSSFPEDVIARITLGLGGDIQDIYRVKAASIQISADGAQAVHPNFTEKHDPAYSPVINGGPTIKMSSNFKYATTAETATFFMDLCEETGVPFQKMINRSDVPSGSTIGPITSAKLGIKTVDVGNPTLAMHSIRETVGTKDHYYMTEVLKKFF